MKIVYSLPHPSDNLDEARAGHIVRANGLLGALENAGHQVERVEAARAVNASDAATALYRRVLRRALPKPLALRLRDAGRVRYGRMFGRRLAEVVANGAPELIFETHVGFSLAGAEASRRTGVPLVVDDVSPPAEEGTAFGEGVGSMRGAERVLREVIARASLLVAVSEHVRDFLAGMGAPDDKIGVLPNGFDGKAFHPQVDGALRRHQLGLDASVPIIAFVGSFLAFHRVDLLIEAFAMLAAQHPVHLLLVGDGPGVADARARLRALDVLDRAHFVGRIANVDVASYVAAADIAALPGALDFGHSMKLFEYMALGKPTVAPELPAVANVARHGTHALLFADGNAAALHAAMHRLLQEPHEAEELGRNAARLAGRHTWSARAETLLQILRDRRIIAV